MSLKSKQMMRFRFVMLLGFTVLCYVSKAVAQHVNYSMYKDAALFVNPALIGSSNELSVSVQHRSQPLTEQLKYNTTSLVFSSPLLDAGKKRRWGGWGISVLNDEVKGSIDFRTQGISAAYAYNLPLSRQHYLSFGMQAGLYQRNISMRGLSTSSQWLDNAGYVSSLSNGESISDGRKNYFALSGGALFYKEDEFHRQVARLGVAGFNLNRPNVSMTDQNDNIPMKFTALGSLALMELSNFLLHAEGLYYRENNKNTYHLGARASYYFDPAQPNKGSIDVKAGYRVNNAITTELQVHQPNFTVAFAYDFGISSKESYNAPNDVPEVLLTVKKWIGASKPKAKQAAAYNTLEEVREFYFNEQPAEASSSMEKEKLSENPDSSFSATAGFKLKRDFKFGFNDAVLNEESKAYLDDLFILLESNQNIHMEVLGHTDNVGSKAANERVSMKRAQVVVDYLIAKGIDQERLTPVAMSDKQPLMKNESEAARALNRRVEFIIYR